jgi:hypothetical protein
MRALVIYMFFVQLSFSNGLWSGQRLKAISFSFADQLMGRKTNRQDLLDIHVKIDQNFQSVLYSIDIWGDGSFIETGFLGSFHPPNGLRNDSTGQRSKEVNFFYRKKQSNGPIMID